MGKLYDSNFKPDVLFIKFERNFFVGVLHDFELVLFKLLNLRRRILLSLSKCELSTHGLLWLLT
jgi:hypothetical protein